MPILCVCMVWRISEGWDGTCHERAAAAHPDHSLLRPGALLWWLLLPPSLPVPGGHMGTAVYA